ncbi:hypothetical protein QJS10_CPA08g01854 [Acorus calamus]|uniref:DUF868 family protein n=1 Tax=Acorus calamus TaxID=4465 RepID=A0AAV9EE91_ACOCL|nr:hypothetical protein QJS10_CPA08g01854 [Acorus calamus]
MDDSVGKQMRSSSEKTTTTTSEDHPATSNKAGQWSVVSIYRTLIAGSTRNVTVTWSKNLINHSFSMSIDNHHHQNNTTTTTFSMCKVDLKPWPFWTKKGLKSLDIDDDKRRVEVFWDLRSVKFSNGPEPVEDYYVAVVSDEEVVLLLGDKKKEAYKRTKSRPSLTDAVLVCKRENVTGKKCFITARARFKERGREHKVVIENSISISGGAREPEMWISVDGKVLVHVDNLNWKFRGNERVVVDDVPVEVLWDAHDWVFGGSRQAEEGEGVGRLCLYLGRRRR